MLVIGRVSISPTVQTSTVAAAKSAPRPRGRSFKSLDFRQPHSYRMALPLAAMILLLAFYPEAFLPVMALAYALSGPVLWLLSRLGIGRPTLPPSPPVSEGHA